MKRQFPFTTLLLAGCLFATNSNAATSGPDPREKLGFFAGGWTVKGSEATYTEKCEWLSKKKSIPSLQSRGYRSKRSGHFDQYFWLFA